MDSEGAQRYLQDIAKSYGATPSKGKADIIRTPEEAEYLFSVRFNLEQELRRLYSEYVGQQEERFFSVRRVVDRLVALEILDPGLAHVIREVYAICSAGVHGQDVSNRQMQFVRDTVPGLVTSLRAIRRAE